MEEILITTDAINAFNQYQFKQWVKKRFKTGFYYGWTKAQITEAIIRGLNLEETEENVLMLEEIGC